LGRTQVNLANFTLNWYTHDLFSFDQIKHAYPENCTENTGESSIVFENLEFILSRNYPHLRFSYKNKYPARLSFINCVFLNENKTPPDNSLVKSNHKGVVFSKCTLNTLILNGLNTVKIEDCVIINTVLTDNKDYELTNNNLGYIKLHDGKIMGSLELAGNKGENIWLSNVEIEGNLRIAKVATSVKLRNVTIKNGDLTIRNSALGEESYIDSAQTKYCAIQDNIGEDLKVSNLTANELSIYRNKISLAIEASTLDKSKINQNRDGSLLINNTSFIESSIIKDNRLDKINLFKTDLTHVTFAGNQGELAIANTPVGSLPDLTIAGFSNIELKEIELTESWDLKLSECQAISLDNVALSSLVIEANKLDHLQLKQSKTPIDIRVMQCINFDLSEHASKGPIDLYFQKIEKVEITECICPSLKIQSEKCKDLSIKSLQATEFEGVVKGGDTVHISGLLKCKTGIIRTNDIKEVSLKSVGCDYLNLNISNCDTLFLLECHKSVTKDIDSLSAPNEFGNNHIKINAEDLSELSANSCYSQLIEIKGSDIQSLSLAKNQAPRLQLTDSNLGELQLDESSHDVLKIQSVTSTRIDYDSLGPAEKSNKKLKYLIIEASELDHFLVNHQELKKVSINSLKSQFLDFADSTIDELSILSSNSKLLELGQIDTKKNHSEGWFFPKGPSESVTIEGSQFTKLDAKNISLASTFRVKNSSIEYLLLVDLTSKLFSSEGSIFSKLILIRGQSKEGKEIEVVSQFDKFDYLTISSSTASLGVTNSKVNHLLILHSHLSTFLISQCDKGLQYDIEKALISSTELQNLIIENSHIRKLNLDNLSPNKFLIDSVKTQNLVLRRFKQDRGSNKEFELSFINTVVDHKAGKLEFIDSDLSGLRMNSCYFGTFSELVVKSSTLDKISCTATTWPKKVNSLDGRDKYFEIREACRQLKLAMVGHQDKVSELQFHSLEMGAYRKIVRKEKWWTNMNDRLTLLGGSTNKFGRDWTLPVALFIPIITLTYIALLWSQYELPPWENSFWSCYNWPDYFKLFNPTHRISQLFGGAAPSGLAAFVDFLSKIISAFFIYQIVAAFRKFKRG